MRQPYPARQREYPGRESRATAISQQTEKSIPEAQAPLEWALVRELHGSTALARGSQKKAGVENVEFLKGEIENIPLPDNTVDVIISNCVINLSADKDRVLKEAYRCPSPKTNRGRFREDVPDLEGNREYPQSNWYAV